MANDTNFRRDIVAGVKENFGKYLPVLEAVIPSTVRLAEISTTDKSIFRHRRCGCIADAEAQEVNVKGAAGLAAPLTYHSAGHILW